MNEIARKILLSIGLYALRKPVNAQSLGSFGFQAGEQSLFSTPLLLMSHLLHVYGIVIRVRANEPDPSLS